MSRIVTNLTNQRVNVSDSTTLECEVTGTPTPTVVWTKDNQTVMEGSGVQSKTSVDVQKKIGVRINYPLYILIIVLKSRTILLRLEYTTQNV